MAELLRALIGEADMGFRLGDAVGDIELLGSDLS
jgi:hypothetical protein